MLSTDLLNERVMFKFKLNSAQGPLRPKHTVPFLEIELESDAFLESK